jgi:DNA (cytosine-5)-methyltransferase 1
VNKVQSFNLNVAEGFAYRKILRRREPPSISAIKLPAFNCDGTDPHDLFDVAWLQAKVWPQLNSSSRTLKVADLFCGCGGLSLGLWEACRALQIIPEFKFACDLDGPASEAYQENFSPACFLSSPVEEAVDGELGARLSKAERTLKDKIGSIDFVLAGPPCQGHSDLNNHTRRDDPKNQLVLRVARFAEIFKPRHILIENVQGIRHDKSGALDRAREHLRKIGYQVSEALLQAELIGVPQSRRRFFMFASLDTAYGMDLVLTDLKAETRPLSWAISDLLNEYNEKDVFNSSSVHSATNRERIEYLFRHNLHELPNTERPDCHKLGNHSYTSVYGRMFWDKPAPTITTGFGSMGQGRFVHPLVPRTMTPHEAARVQFFPDFFKFPNRGRRQYQSLIGNAVPSKLAYAIAVHQLR